MEALKNHNSIISKYKKFLKSFFTISDTRIKEEVEKELNNNSYLPEPLVQFNPSYKKGQSLSDFPAAELHPELQQIIGSYTLYHHQIEAIKKGIERKRFIVTSGTGSGKSLTFLTTIFNDILQHPAEGVRAILVYPMNALINSQEEEIMKYEINYLISGLPAGVRPTATNDTAEQLKELRTLSNKTFPITYKRYTGQEDEATKKQIREQQPHIILTNYMMLELIMTRSEEREMRDKLAQTLRYLVFDELHTYRGRQGADVSMLVRRIKNRCTHPLISIGTSATMSSEGSPEEKKKAIAKVANLIFDENYTIDQIIGEKLDTSTHYKGTIPGKDQLAEAILQPIPRDKDATHFRNHPLAIWLETTIALAPNSQGDFERGKPLPLSKIATTLSQDSGQSYNDCLNTLEQLLGWIETLNIQGAEKTPRESYLPFKLHQFISQTGTVKVSLHDRQERHITLDDENYHKVGDKDIPLYPVLFSRYSGVDFICVKLINGRLLPRDPDNPEDQPEKITQNDIKADKETGKQRRTLTINDFPYGYLILDDAETPIWEEEDKYYLPDSWFNPSRTALKNFYEHRLPVRLYFNSQGGYSWRPGNTYPLQGWYMPAYLLFDPTSGIIFDLKTSENTKLSRLGNEGRSSATTILGASILKTLQEAGTPADIQKFLSFTDNRQDASLQAGHFNAFFTQARLRSAIYQVVKRHPEGIDASHINFEVFRELKLPLEEYARNSESTSVWGGNEKADKALQKYLMIRILYDLKLGWRYTTPNLEQTALLKIEYYRLSEFCANQHFFTQASWLLEYTQQEREDILVQVLNYFRTSFAFDHIYLVEKREEVEEEIRQTLNEKKHWSLNFDEKIDAPNLLFTQPSKNLRTREFLVSIGPRSYVGKYLKRLIGQKTGQRISEERLLSIIEGLCNTLVAGEFLKKVSIHPRQEQPVGYRIRTDNLIWKPADGHHITPDKVRFAKYKKEINITPNPFFQEFYKQDFKHIEGNEHTGQLSNTDRQHREEAFRRGKLSALFCSPTMELGIDINQLNIVHMRNVPPRPDNYAQRSGRAGRSGQSALIYTFCSKGSPHDRNYFKSPDKMVHGIVVPAKMDLTNEELIKSHLNAYILMELALHIKTSVGEVLDIDLCNCPLKSDIAATIGHIPESTTNKWIAHFKEIIAHIPGVEQSNWYSDLWLTEQAQQFPLRFDEAFNRWRVLWRRTTQVIDEAQNIIRTPNHPGINDAKRMQAIALRQRELLLNKNAASVGNESEFYVFRYLASEGFLPGYNFTRLPVRAYMGKKAAGQGEYISRPRFIALREFGPNNLIYHNGNKYKIVQMQLNQQKGELLQTLTVSHETGYVFIGAEGDKVNNDPITHKELTGNRKIANVVELNESEAHIEERISCDEENRVAQGYEVENYFSFSKGADKVQKATILAGEHPLLQLIYDQSATLLQVNNKWKVTNEEAFPIGKVSGRWKKRDPSTYTVEDPVEKVRIYTTTTSDILYIQPVKELQLDEEGVCSLAFALKQAIENIYQVEESEMGVWMMGKENKNILLYESSEGSLGILKDLMNDSRQLQKIFTEAYTLLGFDPETHTDRDPQRVRASYEDLLSYYNQRYHDKLNRFSVKPALEKLMQCTIDNQQGGNSLDEQYRYLIDNHDLNSSTERPLIEYLYRNGYKLPDRAQHNVKGLYVSADFVYKLSDRQFALIFCDGSVHDLEEVKEADRIKRQNCRTAGYEVIEWHYSEPIEEFVTRNKHIFRKVR